MGKKKRSKGDDVRFKAYSAEKRAEKNKAKKIAKHLKKHPNDLQSKG